MERPICGNCRNTGVINEQFDAYFCADCNTWLERKCEDTDCEYCPTRPSVPPKPL